MGRHKPIVTVVHGREECLFCGAATVGVADTLRHVNEEVPVVTPAREDARAVERAMEIAVSVARRLPHADPHVVSQAVTQELYLAGLLRRRRGERRGSVLLSDDDREPDHAERAAGEARSAA